MEHAIVLHFPVEAHLFLDMGPHSPVTRAG